MRSAENSCASVGALQHSMRPARTRNMDRALLGAAMIEAVISDIRSEETFTSKAAPTGPSSPTGATSFHAGSLIINAILQWLLGVRERHCVAEVEGVEH